MQEQPNGKRCTRCGEFKPLECFYYRKDRDAYRGTCKDCMADDRTPERRERNRQNTREWQRKNVEHRRAYMRANRDRQRLYARKYRDANREAMNARDRERYAANPEAYIEKTQAWVKANPEKARAGWWRHTLARKAQKKAQFVEYVDRRVVYHRDEGVCGICGEPTDPTDFHVDHIVPLSKGGEHSYANAQVAHPICNIQKGAKAP